MARPRWGGGRTALRGTSRLPRSQISARSPDVMAFQRAGFRGPKELLSEFNRSVVANRLTAAERRTLSQIGYRTNISTDSGDFPTAGARMQGRRQTLVNPGVVRKSMRNRGIVPGPYEFGGGKRVQDLLEHEVRHQLLAEQKITPEQHHAVMGKRGGKWARGLVGPQWSYLSNARRRLAARR